MQKYAILYKYAENTHPLIPRRSGKDKYKEDIVSRVMTTSFLVTSQSQRTLQLNNRSCQRLNIFRFPSIYFKTSI